jgi:hypothetical protein
MLSDLHLVQQIEGQIGGLGTPGLSHLQNVIARQLGQQQR